MVLTGATIVLLFFFGLPIVVKFAAFLTDIRKSSIPIEKTDTTPPAPPNLKNLPEATNKSSLNIDGMSESGATVSVFLNRNKTEIVANGDGAFTTTLRLNSGDNVIYALAKDAQGNESQKTDEFTITFDNDAPKLEISSPSDGTAFSGSKNQRVTITGQTEADAALTINDKYVSIADDGGFSFSTNLSEGDNTFTVKTVDKAGNTTQKSLTLKYSP